MIKPLFDNSGVAQVQHAVLTLPYALRLLEAQEVRTNFPEWLSVKFLLTSNQAQQINTLPDELRLQLSDGIANCFEQGMPVQFFKEEKQTDESIKDIIINGSNSLLSDTASEDDYPGHFHVYIRYRTP